MQRTQQFYETTQGEYLTDLLNTGGRHTKSHKSRIGIIQCILMLNCSNKTVKRRSKKNNCKSILERYHITIKPKFHKSSSLSDLSQKPSNNCE